MTENTGTIAFSTLVQQVLWDHELTGQISDGAWENDPSSRYEFWCSLDSIVDPADIGVAPRLVWNMPSKRGFAFARQLMEWVGDRMLAYARLTLAYGPMTYSQLSALQSVAEQVIHTRDTGAPAPDYMREYAETAKPVIEAHPEVNLVATVEDDSLYSEKDLRADLAAINKTLKVDRRTPFLPRELRVVEPEPEPEKDVSNADALAIFGVY
jgi:hypothetical protein